MARLAPTKEVLRQLFAHSGNRCAFPQCDHILVNEKGEFVAQVCHIEGVKGERYNANQTDEARRDADNLLLLCYRHHVETDDVSLFPVERMKEMKAAHELKQLTADVSFNEEVIDAIHQDLSQKLDQVISNTESLLTQFGSISTLLRSIDQRMGSSIEQAAKDEAGADPFVQMIKDLKKQGKVQTALDLLRDRKAKDWDGLAEAKKIKIIAQIADCHFNLHETNIAAQTLLELKNLTVETEESLALLSLAYAVLGQQEPFQECFRKVKQHNPDNANAWIAFIWISGESEFDESGIPTSLMSSPEVLFNIAEKHIKNGDRKKGIDSFRKCLALQKGSAEQTADTKSMIAARLLGDLTDPFRYHHGHYTAEERQDLDEAILFYTEAWDVFKLTELRNSRAYILLNRGVAHKVKREADNALADFQQAYDLWPVLLAYKNLTAQYCQMGKLEPADRLTTEWENKSNLTAEERYAVALVRARILFLKNEVERSIDALKRLYNEYHVTEGLEILSMIISFLLQKQRHEEADTYADQLLEAYPGFVTGYIFKSTIAQKMAGREKALELLHQANDQITADTSPFEVYELARHFAEAEDYGKAAALFNQIANKGIANALSRGLLYSYYQGGQVGPALSLAESLYLIDKGSPFVVETITNLYMEIQQIDKARQVLEEYLPVAPERLKDSFLLRCAHVHYLLRNFSRAVELILQISQFDQFAVDEAFLGAKILVNCKETEHGKGLALQARNRHFHECVAHETYIAVFRKIGDQETALFPDAVGSDSVAILEEDNGEVHPFYLGRVSLPGKVTILSPEDPLAKLLIGKKVGDECSLVKKYGLSTRYRITAILDVHVFAFRQSMELLDTKFAGQTGFVVVKNGPESFTEHLAGLLRNVEAGNREYKNQAFWFYDQGIATIGTLAGLFRENYVLQWFKLVSSVDLSVICRSRNENEDLARALREHCPLVLDLSSLLTLFFITSQVDHLGFLSNQLIVARSTITELQEACDELSVFRTNGRLSVSYQDGELMRGFINKEDIENQLTTLENILSWCYDKTTIQIPQSLAILQREERKNMTSFFHQSAYDTALLAVELKGIVVSNDDTFKRLARGQFGLSSFSTFQLLLHQFDTQQISSDQAEQVALSLILHNHLFIPATSPLLFKAFEHSGFEARKPFLTAVKGLRAMTPFYGANHAVRFIKQLYLDPGFALTRRQTSGYVVAELFHQNRPDEIKAQLKAAVSREFQLLPIAAAELLGLINSYPLN